MSKDKLSRNSSIELLKIFAIFIIVISHVVKSLYDYNPYIDYKGFMLDMTHATASPQQLILTMLSYCGVIGNTIFFISSAWFLLDSKRVNSRKWFFMLVEIWTISICILLITYVARAGQISMKIIMECLMPTTFSTNWYMTCYLLFYPIHTILNKIIEGIDKAQHLGLITGLSVIYMGFNFLREDLFFPSVLIIWITIYFVMAYVKLYLQNTSKNTKLNLLIVVLGLLANTGLVLLSNYIGLRLEDFSELVLRWNKNSNPFIIIVVISLFNLIRNVEFHNRFINYISGLSLIIYIIHENLILRTYYRTYIINYIYENFGYDYIVLWMILLAAAIFTGTAVISSIYEFTLRGLVKKLSGLVYIACCRIWEKIQKLALRLN